MNDVGLMSRELFSVLATMDTLKDRWLWYHHQVQVIGSYPKDKKKSWFAHLTRIFIYSCFLITSPVLSINISPTVLFGAIFLC